MRRLVVVAAFAAGTVAGLVAFPVVYVVAARRLVRA